MSNKLFIILLIIVAGFLRFWRLGDVPVGFHRDEAFLGYNAYSIMKTGRDMSGQLFPLHLESFLYSPAGYSYAAIPFIAIFGLNEFAVRAPAALFGTASIIVLFFLVRLLFKRELTALLASLVIALSPWHINLSRVATEHVVAIFFYLLGTYLFIRSSLLFSLLSFSATLFLYQAARSFVPVFLLVLFILYRKSLNRKVFLAGYVVGILLPIIIVVASPTLNTRIRTLLPTSTPEAQLLIEEGNRQDGISNIPILVSRFFHNKPRVYITQVVQNYFSHLTYDFFFTDRGLPDRYRIPGSGLLYLVELPLLLIGLYELLRLGNRATALFGGWAALGFLGSALTFDDIPNLQRTIVVLPAVAVIIGMGIVEVWKKSIILFIILIIGYGYSASLYLHQYYVHQLVHRPWFREEGFRKLVPLVNSLRPNYDRVVMTDQEPAPLVFFLFYTPVPPAQFQKETKGISLRHTQNIPFAGLEFVGEQCPGIPSVTRPISPRFLYVNWQTCKPEAEKSIRVISTIRRGDNSPVFQLTEASVR